VTAPQHPLIKLIDRLAVLFPDEPVSRVIVGRADLASGRIEFDARALVNWTNIVGVALDRGKLEDVVRAAVAVYEEAKDLFAYLEEYGRFAAEHGRAAESRLFASYAAEGLADRAAAAGAAAVGWDAVLARAQRHGRRFLAGHRGTPAAPGTFEPELYVRRDAVENALAGFLAGPASALILVGDSGVGKTNVLCRWISDLLDYGHAVLAYDCAALAETDVEREMLRDLAAPPQLAAGEVFEQLDAEASRVERKLVAVFDSISDYRGGEANGVQVLLRRINALAGRTGASVRIVLSCNAATWNRVERLAPIHLDRDRTFRSGDDQPFVRLESFSAEELAAAYPRYRAMFDLYSAFEDLHLAVRERLREPVLLRMTAETYRAVQEPLPANVGLGIYRRFLAERVQSAREQWLVDELAEEMMRRRTGAISISDLARDEELGPEVLNEDASSTYSRLLDRGVLQEWRGNVRAGVLVKFAHNRVAAYALAMHLLQGKPDVRAKAAELLALDAEFPLAWDVARTLLLESGDEAAIARLAGSHDPEERELAAEALVELYADDAKTAGRRLEALLEETSEEARRTALKAAYNSGPAARDFFLRAAIEGDAATRESVKNTLYLIWRNESAAGRDSVTETLYLIWRHAPGFTHELLNTLLGELALGNITRCPTILWFVLDLTITIYVNHCDDEEVIEKTAALLHDLSVERLHLNLLKTGLLGAKVEKLFFGVVARVFARQILEWMLFAEVAPVKTFFALPKESRASLARIADVLDPATDLASAHDDLLEMLQSEVPIFSGSAALAIAVHAVHGFAATEPLVRRLWDEANAGGRLWILMSFSVLLRNTPPEWVGLLEDLTGRWIEQHREAFLGPSSRLAGGLDLVLLPLGLAYGRRRAPMKLFGSILQDAMAASDRALAARSVAALAAVGFYYPEAMFDALRPVMKKLDEEEISGAALATLATVRTLHFDAVDRFLEREGVPEEFRRRMDAASGVALVHRFIRVLGFYNNAVHLSLYYPRMRKPFSAGALKLLAEADGQNRFITEYTVTAVRMLRESGFQVLEWTRPE
jgi:hypothetical protein